MTRSLATDGRLRPVTVTDTLCTRCGLCCDGTLFGDVELAGPAEATRLEILGLNVDHDEAAVELLSLPCTGLHGTRCSIYAHRPRCCRTFECRLLQDTQRGVVTVDHALTQIAHARAQVERVKTLLAQMDTHEVTLPLEERCADAIAAARGSASKTTRAVAALEAAMADVAYTIRTTFLH